MEIKMITCTRCGKEMPELRLTRFGYDFCVNCSQEQPRIGRVVTMGEGDHTWNEIEFINPETARRISEFEKQKSISRLFELDFMEEDPLEDSFQEITHKLISKEQDREEEEEPLSILEELEEIEEEEDGEQEEDLYTPGEVEEREED